METHHNGLFDVRIPGNGLAYKTGRHCERSAAISRCSLCVIAACVSAPNGRTKKKECELVAGTTPRPLCGLSFYARSKGLLRYESLVHQGGPAYHAHEYGGEDADADDDAYQGADAVNLEKEAQLI